jgi:outer membrane protein
MALNYINRIEVPTVHAKNAVSILCVLLTSGILADPVVTLAQPAPVPPAPQLSLSLRAAVQLALGNNLTYQSALTDEKSAEAQVVQARSAFQPKVSAGYSYFHTQSEGAFVFPAPSPVGPPKIQKVVVSAQNVNDVNATLQYALYTGGAAQAAIGQAAANLAATQSQLAGLRATVIQDTTRAYFTLIETRQSAQVADQAVIVAAQDLKTANELFTAGTAAKVDVLRSDVTFADARVNQIRSHNNALLANARLANELNVNLASVINPTETLETQAPSYTLDSLLGSAQTRPELAAANDAVIIADQAVRGARSAYLPDVNIQVQEASSLPNFVNVPQPQLSETLAVTWQLFSGGLTRGKVLQASAQVDKAKINLKSITNDVDLEVREAYFNYTAAQAQVGAALEATQSAAENFHVNQIRYKAGVGTSLELSDALLSTTQAQNQYISALADLRVSLVALQRAAGLLPTTGI